MFVTRNHRKVRHLYIDDYKFERVDIFEYLRDMYVNEDRNSYEEIKLILVVTNRYKFWLVSVFNTKLLSWQTKITLYKILVLLFYNIVYRYFLNNPIDFLTA